MMKRRAGVAALLAVLLVMTMVGCARGAESDARGCGDCDSEIAELREQIEGLDEVESVTEVRYVTPKPLTRQPSVYVWFAPTGDLEAAKSQIAVLVENSSVAPVYSIYFAWDKENGKQDTETWLRDDKFEGVFRPL